MAATPPPANNRFSRFNFRAFLTPAWLAGILSVGFHGVLFAAGPTFSSLEFDPLAEAEESAERRNVPLVELTAAEQERLPDFSGSVYNFDGFSDLEPLSPLFGGSSGGNNRGGDRGLNSQPLLSPRNGANPPSGSRLPFDIAPLQRGRNSPFPFSSGALPPVQQNGGAPPPGSTATGAAKPPAGNNAGAESNQPGADALRPESGELEVSPQEEAEIAANSNPTDTLTLEERLQAYAFDSTNTETAAIESRYGEWLTTGQALATDLEIGDAAAIQSAFEEATAAGILTAVPEAGDADDTVAGGIVQRPIELTLDYGAGICLTKDPQKGLIGAWVGPEGKLLGDPEVIRSTGYLGLNQQAIRYIKTLDFSTVESFTGYQFEVVVNYDPDNCVNVGRNTPATPEEEVSQESGSSDAEGKAPAKAPAVRPEAGAGGTTLPSNRRSNSTNAAPRDGAGETDADATAPAESAPPGDDDARTPATNRRDD